MAARRAPARKPAPGAARRTGGGGSADDGSAADAPPRALAPLPPWLAVPAARLRRMEAAGRLPHALLLGGPAGIGKRAFAHWLAECLLCLAPVDAGACGTCGACRQLLADAHQDYRELRPDGTGIRIDAVRDLMTWQQLSTPDGRWRVALLDGADTMNRNAANALLKTLEEPADGALLVLVADRPGALPATVRSRCQGVTLANGDRAASLAWMVERLGGDAAGGAASGAASDPAEVADGATVERASVALARAGGAPFAALTLAGDDRRRIDAMLDKAWLDLLLHRASIGRIADALSELPAAPVLAGFGERAADALRHAHGAPRTASAAVEPGTDAASEGVAARVAGRLAVEQWFTLRDRVEHLYRIDGPSFRTQAVLEGLLADIRLMLTSDGTSQ